MWILFQKTCVLSPKSGLAAASRLTRIFSNAANQASFLPRIPEYDTFSAASCPRSAASAGCDPQRCARTSAFVRSPVGSRAHSLNLHDLRARFDKRPICCAVQVFPLSGPSRGRFFFGDRQSPRKRASSWRECEPPAAELAAVSSPRDLGSLVSLADASSSRAAPRSAMLREFQSIRTRKL